VTLPCRLDDLAVADIESAADWYDRKLAGLGRRFIGEVGRVLATVSLFPNGYPVRQGNVRRVLLRRFPFQILYQVMQDEFVVLAVFDQRHDPKSVPGRIDDMSDPPR
jgi:plasmid stabilization system protein ParE